MLARSEPPLDTQLAFGFEIVSASPEVIGSVLAENEVDVGVRVRMGLGEARTTVAVHDGYRWPRLWSGSGSWLPRPRCRAHYLHPHPRLARSRPHSGVGGERRA